MDELISLAEAKLWALKQPLIGTDTKERKEEQQVDQDHEKESHLSAAQRRLNQMRRVAINISTDKRMVEMKDVASDDVDVVELSQATGQRRYILEWQQQFIHKLKLMLHEIQAATDPISAVNHVDRVYAWYKNSRFPPEHSEGARQRLVHDFHEFGANEDIQPGSAFWQATPREGEEEEPQPDETLPEGPVTPGRPEARLPSARERLQNFKTKQLCNIQRLQEMTQVGYRNDSPSPERPGTPSTVSGGYTSRSYTSSRPTTAHSRDSRPPTALSSSRPATPMDYGRSSTAMSDCRRSLGVESRPTTAGTASGSRYGSRPQTASQRASSPLQAWGVSVSGRALPSGPQPRTPSTPCPTNRSQRTVAEYNMDQRWLAKRHKEVADKEREEDHKEALEAWAERRARVEEEISRNAEAARFTSVLQRCEYVPPADAGDDVESYSEEEALLEGRGSRPQSAPSSGPKRCNVTRPAGEAPVVKEPVDLDREMIQRIRMLNADLLHTTAGVGFKEPCSSVFDDSMGAEKHISLSPYLQVVPGGGTEAVSQKLEDSSDVLGGACSLWQSKHQQSTAGNSGLTLDQIRLKQLQEVEKIKRTLGHHNRPCNAAVLERALVMPQQKLKKNVGLYNALPRLLINPFYEGEVKKKKGKKKRGKSKKPK